MFFTNTMKPSVLEECFPHRQRCPLSCRHLSPLPALPQLTCVVFRVGLHQANPALELISLALLPLLSRACLGLTQELVGTGDLGLYFSAVFQHAEALVVFPKPTFISQRR